MPKRLTSNFREETTLAGLQSAKKMVNLKKVNFT